MHIYRKESGCILMIIVVMLTVLSAWSCTTVNHYSYDLGMNFVGLKTYNWNPSPAPLSQYSLVDSNVQFIADQILVKKGFKKSPEKPDFMISIDYEYENDIYYHQYGYQLRLLTLNIYRVENKKLIWQGTKFGSIDTGESFSDLKTAVAAILSEFPPK